MTPVVPVQGSVGASGDLAPLAHMAAAMIGVGEVFFAAGGACRRTALSPHAGLAPLALGPKEGLALLNGTQFSTAYALAALFEAERLFQSALVTRRALDRCGARVRCAVRSAHPRACAAIAARSRPRRRCGR